MALVNKLVGIPSHTVTHSIGGVKGDGPSGQRLHHGPASQHTEAVRDMREILRLVPRLRKRMSEWTPSEDTMGATSYPNAPASCSYTQVHERHDRRGTSATGAHPRSGPTLPASGHRKNKSQRTHQSHKRTRDHREATYRDATTRPGQTEHDDSTLPARCGRRGTARACVARE